MQVTPFVRAVAFTCLGIIICLATVMYIRQGQEAIRQEVAASAKVRTDAEGEARERENRTLLLLEVIKQTQAIAISEKNADRRIDDMQRGFNHPHDQSTAKSTE